MPENKFSCPHCEQHIQADSGYAGLQMACPACQGRFVVPGIPLAAPTPPPPPQPPPAPASVRLASATSTSCPSCGNALARGAVLCTACGYNLSTGVRTVAGRPAAPGKSYAAQTKTKWYRTPYPYVGLVLVTLGLLYLLGSNDRTMMVAFVGLAELYQGVVGIIVLVAAFQDGLGTGFATLCIPFYSVYFVFVIKDSNTLRVLYAAFWLVLFAIILIGRSHAHP